MKHLFLSAIAILLLTAVQAQNPYWSQVGSGTGKQLMSISFGSPLVGYISGADSLLLKTTDGGISWHPVNHSGLNFGIARPDIVHINFLNDTLGFAVVSNYQVHEYHGTLHQTNDGGLTWAPLSPGNIAVFTSYFFDALNGFVGGSAFFAGQTLINQTAGIWGAGKTFSYQPFEFLYTIDFRNPQLGVTGGWGGYVYRTFDGGASWDTVKTVIDSTIYSLKFVDDSTIIGATHNPSGAVIVSTDTGRTWQMDPNTLTFYYPTLRDVTVSKKDSFIAVGKVSWDTAGLILWWQGSTNTFVMTVPHPLNAAAMRDDSVAFLVGDHGLIMTNRDLTVSVPQAPQTPAGVRVFPNPASDRVRIAMDAPHRVRLLDLSGRLLRVTTQSLLWHELDLADLAPGLYLLEIQTETGATFSRKLLKQ